MGGEDKLDGLGNVGGAAVGSAALVNVLNVVGVMGVGVLAGLSGMLRVNVRNGDGDFDELDHVGTEGSVSWGDVDKVSSSSSIVGKD